MPALAPPLRMSQDSEFHRHTLGKNADFFLRDVGGAKFVLLVSWVIDPNRSVSGTISPFPLACKEDLKNYKRLLFLEQADTESDEA